MGREKPPVGPRLQMLQPATWGALRYRGQSAGRQLSLSVEPQRQRPQLDDTRNQKTSVQAGWLQDQKMLISTKIESIEMKGQYFSVYTFGPWVFSLADCGHGVMIHWWGLNVVEKKKKLNVDEGNIYGIIT